MTPADAARQVIEKLGDRAVFAVIECALAASADGRDEDYRFWIAVFHNIRGSEAPRQTMLSTMGNA